MSILSASDDGVAVLTRGIANACSMSIKVDGTSASITGGTYSLQSLDGTVIQTGTVASGGAITGGITPGASAQVGAAREVWTVTTSTATYIIHRSAMITAHSVACPIESGTIVAGAPYLSTFPGAQTSWWTQIAVAWGMTLHRIVAESALAGSSDLWNSDELQRLIYAEAMHVVHMAAAGYGAEPYVTIAAFWREQADIEWERLKLTYNTDTDAAAEAHSQPVRTGQVSTAAARA